MSQVKTTWASRGEEVNPGEEGKLSWGWRGDGESVEAALGWGGSHTTTLFVSL